MDKIEKDFDSFMGQCFEEIATEFIKGLADDGAESLGEAKIGRWWNRKGDEIDIVIMADEQAKPVLVECKWDTAVDAAKIVERLKEKAALAFPGKQVWYAIIARGFRARTEQAKCYDMKDLEIEFGKHS